MCPAEIETTPDGLGGGLVEDVGDIGGAGLRVDGEVRQWQDIKPGLPYKIKISSRLWFGAISNKR